MVLCHSMNTEKLDSVVGIPLGGGNTQTPTIYKSHHCGTFTTFNLTWALLCISLLHIHLTFCVFSFR